MEEVFEKKFKSLETSLKEEWGKNKSFTEEKTVNQNATLQCEQCDFTRKGLKIQKKRKHC